MSLFFAGKTNKAVCALSYFLSTKHSPRVGHPSAGSDGPGPRTAAAPGRQCSRVASSEAPEQVPSLQA